LLLPTWIKLEQLDRLEWLEKLNPAIQPSDFGHPPRNAGSGAEPNQPDQPDCMAHMALHRW
jgi:hypothetical protein